jgi:photosystem II stability/assembly factor-like uncharacterized protein
VGRGPDGTAPANAPAFAGIVNGAVYTSTDTGKTWKQVSPTTFSNSVTAVIPLANGKLYVASESGFWTLNKDSGNWDAVHNYSWAKLNAAIIISEGANDHILLGTGNGVLASTPTGWAIQSSGIWAHAVIGIAVSADQAVVITHGGIYHSPDAGKTWKFIGYTKADLSCVAAGPNGAFYVGTRSTGNPTGVLCSTDSGATWKVATATNLPQTSTYALAVDSHGAVYAATQKGLWKSTDQAGTWAEMDKGPGPGAFVGLLALPDGSLYTCSRDGIFRSADSAATWTTITNGLKSPHAETLAASPDGTLYACSGPNIYSSADQGANWVWKSIAPLQSPGPLVMAPGANKRVYAADRQTGVWTSADGGANWVSIASGLPTPQALSILLTPAGQLMVGLNGASLYQIPAR